MFPALIVLIFSFFLPYFEKLSKKVTTFPEQFLKPPVVVEKEKPFCLAAFGEVLSYGIYSAGIKVGKATITYKGKVDLDGHLVDVVVLQAQAPGFRDTDTIYGLIESFTPIKVERAIELFGEKVQIVERYNPETNEVEITRKGKEVSVNKIKSEKKLGNIILLLYYFRCSQKRFSLGEKLAFNLPTKQLELVVDKYQPIKVPKGKFNSLFIQSVPPKFKLWLDEEKEYLPLRIHGAIGFGNTYLALIDIQKPQ